FENIVFSNSVIYNNDVALNARVIAGIAVEMVDGGSVDGVMISNIRMQNVRTPVFIRLGRRSGGPETSLRNVTIQGLDASGSILTSSITGVPGSRISDVTLQDVRIRTLEGGDAAWANLAIPEVERKYPEARMFGRLPAYGLYVRHADRIRLHNLELIAEKPDGRSALLCEDVHGINISELEATAPAGSEPVISLRNTVRAFIHSSRAPESSAAFLQVSGSQSFAIALAGNDLKGAAKAVVLSDGAGSASVRGDI
ncbi:MAG TPA: glycoside hydrolase family 28 protein, partial [Acidobacteriaceae bacterium]